MPRLLPKSLLGQMLLSVAAALLVAQGISGVLLYRAAEQRREASLVNGLAFQLIAEPRIDYREFNREATREDRLRDGYWQRLRVERRNTTPRQEGDIVNHQREEDLREILTEQGVDVADLVVVSRPTLRDDYVMDRVGPRISPGDRPNWERMQLVVAGMLREGDEQWRVARLPPSDPEPRAIGSLILQTLVLYFVLVGGLAFLLRRITLPLKALTARMETFGGTRALDSQLEPSGPDDTRRLIAAHNAMEARIAALLDEKDVMLGAIGHDLKTPLAALRVRIESVEDDHERARMAASIEDITRTLDDILSLARVGRSSDPLERTDISALVASVVEEYEDMGDPVELGETRRLAMRLRATWLRRALRNLIGNALRYGGSASVSVQRQNGYAVIRIEDRGPGIPDGDIEGMLEPFARGEVSRNRETGGAGLGLTLARAIAEQHGGTLSLRNRLGEGHRVEGLIAELRLPIS